MLEDDLQKLTELVHYDLVTSIFTWKVREELRPQDKAFNTSYAGTEIKRKDTSGYIQINVAISNNRRRVLLAHRVAWFFVKGVWPKESIDHINRNRSDNRWMNLRLATSVLQGHNMKLSIANTSGYKGVSWDKGYKKWLAQIYWQGNQIRLGFFPDKEDARKAYIEASIKYAKEFSIYAN